MSCLVYSSIHGVGLKYVLFPVLSLLRKKLSLYQCGGNKKGIEYTCLKLGGPPEPFFSHLGCNWFICSVGP